MESLKHQIQSLMEQNQELQTQLDTWEESHMQLNVSTGTDMVCFASSIPDVRAVEDYPALLMNSSADGTLFYVDSFESSRWSGWTTFKLDGNITFAAHATGTANYNTVSLTETVPPNFRDTILTRLGVTCHELLLEYDHSKTVYGHTAYVIPHVLFGDNTYKDIVFATDVGWLWTEPSA